MVLLGRRRSIGSILRKEILDHRSSDSGPEQVLGLQERAQKFKSVRAPPCYIVFCNGNEVAVIEKDLDTGRVRSSKSFLVHTNHDVVQSVDDKPEEYAKASFLGHEEWLEESTNRKECFENKWNRHLKRNQSQQNTKQSDRNEGVATTYPIQESTLKRWVSSGTTMADCTHFACVMDAKSGEIRWLRRGPMAQNSHEDSR